MKTLIVVCVLGRGSACRCTTHWPPLLDDVTREELIAVRARHAVGRPKHPLAHARRARRYGAREQPGAAGGTTGGLCDGGACTVVTACFDSS